MDNAIDESPRDSDQLSHRWENVPDDKVIVELDNDPPSTSVVGMQVEKLFFEIPFTR